METEAMTALFLSPHNDDECLFGTWSLLAEHPHVVVCLRSFKQAGLGISAQAREAETRAAMRVLGCEWEQGTQPDTMPDMEALEAMMRATDRERNPERVYAPAIEDGGHEQHNLIGRLAAEVFRERVQPYLTYRRGHMRTRSENEVRFQPEWPVLKLQALSCYRSQIMLNATRPWFLDDTLREYRP